MSNTDTAEVKGLDLDNPIHLQVDQRLRDLEAALVSKDPMIRTHLAEIHKHMIQHEEIVHLLSDEQLEGLMRAQQAHTQTTLIAETKGKSSKTLAKAAKLGLDDL